MKSFRKRRSIIGGAVVIITTADELERSKDWGRRWRVIVKNELIGVYTKDALEEKLKNPEFKKEVERNEYIITASTAEATTSDPSATTSELLEEEIHPLVESIKGNELQLSAQWAKSYKVIKKSRVEAFTKSYETVKSDEWSRKYLSEPYTIEVL
jgi:hypothetical protein